MKRRNRLLWINDKSGGNDYLIREAANGGGLKVRLFSRFSTIQSKPVGDDQC